MKFNQTTLEGIIWTGSSPKESHSDEHKLIVAVRGEVWLVDKHPVLGSVGTHLASIIPSDTARITGLAAEGDKIYYTYFNKIYQISPSPASDGVDVRTFFATQTAIKAIAVRDEIVLHTGTYGLGAIRGAISRTCDAVFPAHVSALPMSLFNNSAREPYNQPIYSDINCKLHIIKGKSTDPDIDLAKPDILFSTFIVHPSGIFLWKESAGTVLQYDHLTGKVLTIAQREMEMPRCFTCVGNELYDGGEDGKIYSTFDDFHGDHPLFTFQWPVTAMASLPTENWNAFVKSPLTRLEQD